MTAGLRVTSKFSLSVLIRNAVVHNPQVLPLQPGGLNVLSFLHFTPRFYEKFKGLLI